MTYRAVSVLVLLVVGVSSARAQGGEVVLHATNQGQVLIVFPDKTVVEWGPAALSRDWSYTGPWAALMAEGDGRELFETGQTTLLPISGQGGKYLTVFAQLQPDPQDRQLLRFLYRFSADAPVTFNSAYLELRLPVKSYAGAKLETLGGLKCEPALTVDPPAKDAHLANGSASGVVIAPDAPHGFRLETDKPHWTGVNDERTWAKQLQVYTIQSCAYVTSAGTTLEPGQSAEVRGTIRFNAPQRVQPPPPVVPPAAGPSAGDLRADFAEPWAPCWRDAAGERVLATHLSLRGVGDPAPTVDSSSRSVDPPGLTVSGTFWSNQATNAGYATWQQASAKTGELTVRARLTALSAFRHGGVSLDTWLPRRVAEGCTLSFVGGPGGKTPSVALQQGRRRAGCALASGVVLRAGAETRLQLSAPTPAIWEVFATEDGYVLSEWLLGYYSDPACPEAGTMVETDLKCRWGPEPPQ